MRNSLTTLIVSLGLLTAPAMAAPGKKPGDASIVGIATSDAYVEVVDATLAETFSTLVGLVAKAGLVDLLDLEGQFTVFAPTNAAFAPFGANADEVEDTLEIVCETDDATSAITNILAHHVADGRRFSNSLLRGKGPKAVNMLNGYVWVNDDATITDGAGNSSTSILVDLGLFDISASNGVIHVIDSVLFPDNVCD